MRDRLERLLAGPASGVGQRLDRGQRKGRDGALALLACQPELAAMGFDQRPGDGQTQPAAAFGPRSGFVGAETS